jgi:hypothetical protein
MLDEAHWAGAAESAAAGRKSTKAASQGRRAEYDREKSKHDTTGWFER